MRARLLMARRVGRCVQGVVGVRGTCDTRTGMCVCCTRNPCQGSAQGHTGGSQHTPHAHRQAPQLPVAQEADAARVAQHRLVARPFAPLRAVRRLAVVAGPVALRCLQGGGVGVGGAGIGIGVGRSSCRRAAAAAADPAAGQQQAGSSRRRGRVRRGCAAVVARSPAGDAVGAASSRRDAGADKGRHVFQVGGGSC
jgi:hypothetical protein